MKAGEMPAFLCGISPKQPGMHVGMALREHATQHTGSDCAFGQDVRGGTEKMPELSKAE